MNFPSIWLLVQFLIASSPWVFSANTVCPRMENYTVTSMETYTEPVVVNTFTWCLQIPPRCPKTRTEMRQRYRIKTETKRRLVNACCEGYVMMSRNDADAAVGCRPYCEKGCLSGICVSPNECQCIPGYQGDRCETACPSGTWGFRCREKCNCTANTPCNPINGQCACPPGLRGQMCNESCPSDRWGPECAFLCDCENSRSKCQRETGRCIDTSEENFFANDATYPRDTEDEENRVAPNWTIVRLDGEPSQAWRTTRLTETAGKDDREMLATTDNPVETTSVENTSAPISVQVKIGTQAYANGNSSTVRPVIVLVSMPERRRNLDKNRGGKFAMKNPFAKHVDDDDNNNDNDNNHNNSNNNNLHGIGSPKTDYVKNVVHKGVQPTPIPLDIALIVVASIVSLGLTSVAVVMVLHMRSKLLEAARISIYEEGKSKSQENENATRISSMVTGGSFPRSSFAVVPESRTILATGNLDDTCCKYANGVATINLRLPVNGLNGLSQDDHYDRPSTTRIHLRSDFDADTEHVYDEIPLQSSPFGARKNA